MEKEVKTEKYPSSVNLERWSSVNVLRLDTAGDFGRLEAVTSHIADLARSIDSEKLNTWDKDRLKTIAEKADMAEKTLTSMFKRLNYSVSNYER